MPVTNIHDFSHAISITPIRVLYQFAHFLSFKYLLTTSYNKQHG